MKPFWTFADFERAVARRLGRKPSARKFLAMMGRG